VIFTSAGQRRLISIRCGSTDACPAFLAAASSHRQLTTTADHNATGSQPICSDRGRGERPGKRRFPTAWTYLTSEGSLVRS
jgi:hypothetical protein